MVRRLTLLAGLICLASLTTSAQGLGDKLEVFGGYSYMHVDANPGFSSNGWEFSGNYKFAPWIGGVADFDGHYGSGNSIHNFLFGPQLSFPARISPFAHFLIGGSHVGIAAHNWSFHDSCAINPLSLQCKSRPAWY